MASVLSAKHYHNEDAAFAYVERHVWPNGPTCPHCGGVERISKMEGNATRKGLHKCYQCRKQFTVRQGTIFESSHVPLHIWLQAIFFVAGSKKGVSSNQLHRTLGVTLKTAWFMSHRIREAMRSGDLAPFGGAGDVVEVDETFIGMRKGAVRTHAAWHKMPVLALVHRESGQARSFVVDKATREFIMPISPQECQLHPRSSELLGKNNLLYCIQSAGERSSALPQSLRYSEKLSFLTRSNCSSTSLLV